MVTKMVCYSIQGQVSGNLAQDYLNTRSGLTVVRESVSTTVVLDGSPAAIDAFENFLQSKEISYGKTDYQSDSQ